ncbi:hypothetical protein GCM10010266_31190 [Streptomyces griseomycini]|nr:hypothetical protein GCM10010266_31190 [Streptomyces griseomycini]
MVADGEEADRHGVRGGQGQRLHRTTSAGRPVPQRAVGEARRGEGEHPGSDGPGHLGKPERFVRRADERVTGQRVHPGRRVCEGRGDGDGVPGARAIPDEARARPRHPHAERDRAHPHRRTGP